MANQSERPGRPSVGVGDGFSAFFGGVGFVLGTPSVWPYAAVPMGVLLVLICGLSGLGFWGAWELSGTVIGDATGQWDTVGRWALTVLMALAAVALASLLGLALAQPLSGFAMEKLSLAQERAVTGRRRPELGFVASTLLGLRVGVVTLLLGGVVLGALVAVDLIFPPAAVVTVPVKFVFVAWLLAWDFVDYPLGLRGYGVADRVGWAARHFGAFTAFGLLWAAVLVVPCVALLLLPMGVAGATRLVVAAEGAEENAPR